MALITGQTAVGTAAVKIAGNYGYATTLHLHLSDNTDNVYIGPAGVTTSTGLKLQKQAHVDTQRAQNDAMYAIASATGPFTLTWLIEGK
jgi:hypothetical protein